MWSSAKWTTRFALYTIKGKLQQIIGACKGPDLNRRDTKWSAYKVLCLEYECITGDSQK